MPYKSEAQRRAMYAAAAGHSTLGIPKSVGAEFVKAGPASSHLPKRVKHPQGNQEPIGYGPQGKTASPINATWGTFDDRGQGRLG